VILYFTAGFDADDCQNNVVMLEGVACQVVFCTPTSVVCSVAAAPADHDGTVIRSTTGLTTKYWYNTANAYRYNVYSFTLDPRYPSDPSFSIVSLDGIQSSLMQFRGSEGAGFGVMDTYLLEVCALLVVLVLNQLYSLL
jgi:hypothetical protein